MKLLKCMASRDMRGNAPATFHALGIVPAGRQPADHRQLTCKSAARQQQQQQHAPSAKACTGRAPDRRARPHTLGWTAAAAGLPATLHGCPRTRELVLLQDERKQVLERGGRPKLGRQRASQQLLLQVERLHRPAGSGGGGGSQMSSGKGAPARGSAALPLGHTNCRQLLLRVAAALQMTYYCKRSQQQLFGKYRLPAWPAQLHHQLLTRSLRCLGLWCPAP